MAGHRLSTGAIEEVLTDHPAIAECAVVAVSDNLKGHVPIGFVILQDGTDIPPEQLNKEVTQMIRDYIGPIACYKETHIVQRLPKTRSGKILRRAIRQIIEERSHKNVPVPPTIDDETALEHLADVYNLYHE